MDFVNCIPVPVHLLKSPSSANCFSYPTDDMLIASLYYDGILASPRPFTMFIVTKMVFNLAHERKDLVYPDEEVLDSFGKHVGFLSLVGRDTRYHYCSSSH